MSESVICAVERTEKPNKVRRQGFIPGVVYGKDIKSTSIKINQKELNKLLLGHAKNTKVRVKLGDEVKNCIIKEVQKDSINGQILHIELQTIRSDDVIRLRVPIVYRGKEKLAAKQLVLEELIAEAEIMGKAVDMPEFVSVDAGDKNLGEKITVKDIQIGNDVKVLDDENKAYAVITAIKDNSEAS